jgi:cell division protein FtsN
VNDEGFREIQLNGKQLIFLFMAATVALVVTFLIGVMVGRNARGGTQAAEAAADVAPDAAVAPISEAPPPIAADAAPQEASAKPAENLSYADRLLRDGPAEEKLKPAQPAQTSAPRQPAPERETQAPAVQEPVAAAPPPPRPAPAAPPARRPAPATPPPTAVAAAPVEATAQPSDPSGPGFAVQVAAYRDRRESDTLAKQLVAKGYPAFVLEPVKGAPTALFRVRVGKYKTLKDAQTVMGRLQNAEQFSTAWIAR